MKIYLKDLLEQPGVSISLYNNLKDIFSEGNGIKIVLEKLDKPPFNVL